MKTAGYVILFLIVVGVVGGSRWRRLYKLDKIHSRGQTDLYLPKEIDLQQLSQIVIDSLQLSHNKKEFKWAAILLGWQTFKSGYYRINHNFSYNSFLAKLAKGNQDPISITIIPGRRESEIISTITRQMRFDSAAAYQVLEDSSFLAGEGISKAHVLGHLFPDTYQFYWTASPRMVFTRIFDEFNQKVTKPFAARFRKIDLSENEVLTLASIIQSEAVHNDEKTTISGLYWNRLKKNMKLQADPTIEFALKTHRRLYFADYKTKSPYNTYLHKGLPPGPIDNPDLSSIKAALFPADNDYLYMVAQPDGYHAFSKTYAKHRQQSKKWRTYLSKQAAGAQKDSTTSPQ
jgi:UPF0755 protein